MKYRDLTPEQKKVICNGCGGKGSWIPVPEFLFHASCNHHDFKYWQGGSVVDRKKADDDFYTMMLGDIRKAKWYKRPYYRMWAYIYYKAVRLKGAKYFSFRKTKRGEDNYYKWGELV